MINIILLSIFLYILFSSICGALSIYISGEKGLSMKKGFLLGFFLNIIGIMIVTLTKEKK